MKNQFVPYELAVKLKELGFDEPCLALYKRDGSELATLDYIDYEGLKGSKNSELTGYWYNTTAPLWQQAFDFLLKKYNLYGVIIPTVTMHWTFKTMIVVEGMVEVPPYNHVDGNDYNNIEEARQACLEKLIELIS